MVKLDPAGSELAYATFLGGRLVTRASAIAVDAAGQRLRDGLDLIQRLPGHAGRLRHQLNGDATTPSWSSWTRPAARLAYATFLGGSGGDCGNGIAVDGAGQRLRDGLRPSSSDFPATPGAFDTSYNG